jgi:dolichol-phosphate mannosyltransferase
MFTPVILWNASHHWVSFQFQFVERFAHPVRPWAGIAAALGGQAAIAAPLAVLAAASIAVRGRRDLFRLSHRRWSKRIIFAAAFSLPLLAVLAVESVRTNVHINWAAPAYLSLMPLAAQQFRRLRRLPISRPIAVNARRSVVATSLGCAIVSAVSLPYVAFVHPNSGFLAYEFGPWPGLALEINHVEEQLERESGREPLVVADGPFELASEIAFYRARMGDDMDGDDDQEHRNAVTGKIVHVIGEAPPCSTTTSQWFFGRRPGNAFPFWLHRRDWVGCDVIYVSPYTDIPGEIAAQTDSATLVALPYLGGKRHYNVIICRCLHQLAQATSTK